MTTLIDSLRKEQDKLDLKQENTHGDYEKMKVVFEMKVLLYKRYLKKEGLTELDRLKLENKKEWIMSHMLGFIEHESAMNLISKLTQRVHELELEKKRVYELEKTVQGLQDYINMEY